MSAEDSGIPLQLLCLLCLAEVERPDNTHTHAHTHIKNTALSNSNINSESNDLVTGFWCCWSTFTDTPVIFNPVVPGVRGASQLVRRCPLCSSPCCPLKGRWNREIRKLFRFDETEMQRCFFSSWRGDERWPELGLDPRSSILPPVGRPCWCRDSEPAAGDESKLERGNAVYQMTMWKQCVMWKCPNVAKKSFLTDLRERQVQVNETLK